MANKFTKEVQKTIIAALAIGNHYEVAAKLGGISYQTLRRWLNKGEEDESGEYYEFKLALDRAVAQSESGHVQNIVTAAAEDYKASLEFLARRHPERWAQSNKVMVAVEKNLEEMLDYLETRGF